MTSWLTLQVRGAASSAQCTCWLTATQAPSGYSMAWWLVFVGLACGGGLCWWPLHVWEWTADQCLLASIVASPAGFFWGRTPLIKLSPKKTWEGFIGGFVFTVISAYFLAEWFCKFKWFTCPREVRRQLKAHADTCCSCIM